ncbi:GNAT family N-acetyltransferase [Alloscardovia venturai]|uniref:GNAT family N-acetyltransferase n=1 Tax=Alloscardovia venturai TaxID=1769421 RepID=A0ABW2Y336_9BIFI
MTYSPQYLPGHSTPSHGLCEPYNSHKPHESRKSHSDVEIRRARKEDIPSLLELLRQVNLIHAHGRPDLFRITTKYTQADLEHRLERLDDPVFVAVAHSASPDETALSSSLLGHMFCETQDHSHDGEDALFQPIKTLYIDDLCVDEDARGMGVGRSLLEFAQEWATQRGYYNITLGVWELNTNARAFYEAMGMKPQETIMETILREA